VARKVKITRKQIKQDDAFLATMKEVTGKVVSTVSDRNLWDQYRNQLIVGAVALAAVVIALGAIFGVGAVKTAKAEKMMAEADSIFRAPVISAEEYEKNPAMALSLGAYTEEKAKWSAAAEKYGSVAREYPGTSFGKLANFYAANSYYELADYEEALALYQAYLDNAGFTAPFAPLARQSAGYAQEEMGKLADAEATFLSLVKDENVTTSFLAMFDLARVYEKQDKFDKAIETLKKIESVDVTLNPKTNKLKRQAEAKLRWLEAEAQQDAS
jgi:tetratricopeptide (TPR) repeat protein